MKKILHTTILSCLLASGASAHIGDLMYVRGDITYSKFNSVSIGDNKTTSGANTLNIKGGKYSHKYNFGGVFGLGYIIKEKLRTELVYNKVYAEKFKFSNQTAGTSARIKVDVNAFLGRIAYDVLDIGRTQFYVGGGLGIANVRHKVLGSTSNITPAPAQFTSLPFKFKSKSRNNVAYSLMFGSSSKITDSLRAEVGYSFTDYGQTSRVVGMSGGKIILRSHNLSVGLRFDLM